MLSTGWKPRERECDFSLRWIVEGQFQTIRRSADLVQK